MEISGAVSGSSDAPKWGRFEMWSIECHEMIRDGLDANETLFLKTHGVYEDVPMRRGKGAS